MMAKVEEREVMLEGRERELDRRAKDIGQREDALKKVIEKNMRVEHDLELRETQLAEDIAEHRKWLDGLKPPRVR